MVVKRTLTVFALSIVVSVACSSSGGSGGVPDVTSILSRASAAMATRSFSPRCAVCKSAGTLQYAPPDAIELAHSGGHDAWEYNLIVSDRWFVSSTATRWVEAAAFEHIGMVLSDPRVMLKFASAATLDQGQTTDATYVVRAKMDRDQIVSHIIQNRSSEFAQFDSWWGSYIEGTRVRFWIDRETFTVSQVETDYPALQITPDPEQINPPTPVDPPPFVVSYDFSSPVDVQTTPLSMPGVEASQFDKQVRDGEPVIRRAREAYKRRLGVYPPSLDPVTLHDFLDAPWPDNPYTKQPMRQVTEYSPGDFCYTVETDGSKFRMELFGWDNSLGSSIPSCYPPT